MKRALLSCALLLAAATAASTADSEASELFHKVRAKVLEDVSHVPRYTCVQTVNRSQYRPQYGTRPANCRDIIAARKQLASLGYLISRDRVRLDVAIMDGAETFSWAGARRFETSHVDDLVTSGTTGSGEFVSFLISIFGPDVNAISRLRPTLFAYSIPAEKSHYRYRTNGPERTAGYYGTFVVDAASAELKRLTVETDDFPPEEAACSVKDTMDYHRVKIGNGDFLLPEVATMDVLYNSGIESVNETRYSGCREYAGESTIRFDDGTAAAPTDAPPAAAPPVSAPPAQAKVSASPRPLPSGLRFRIGLTSPIHSDTAAAGDAITGVVLRDVKDRKLGVVASKDDIVHGRILQIEQRMFPLPHWTLAIRFDGLDHRGAEQPLSLEVRDTNRGVFIFEQAEDIIIDQSFHSEWQTR
jgi:hypothetical protein